jgi:transcriptional regulator with XRE-family HTH domain
MNLLQRIREQKGWSKSEVARRARMHSGDYSKIERKILRPYSSQLLKIARAVGIPAAEAHTLLDEVQPAPPAPTAADS